MNQLAQPQQLSNAISLPVPVLLSISFDIDQVGSQLDWSLMPNVRPVTGKDSGGIAFTTGDTVEVEVNAYGLMSDFSSFQIVDCCLVTLPEVLQIGDKVPTLYSAPSPFVQSVGASYPISLDFSVSAEDHVGKDKRHRRITQFWKHNLNVNHAHGRWELSLILTVRIMRGLGNVTETRVFNFDPECQVGDGTDPDDCGHGG